MISFVAIKLPPIIYICHNSSTVVHSYFSDHSVSNRMQTKQNQSLIKWKVFPCYWPCGKFTGDRWILRTRSVTRSFDVFFDMLLNKAGFILHARVCARIRAHTPTVGAAVYTSVAGCAQRIRAHTPTVAVKVQTCWTFKASADQRRHSSQSRKHSKVTEGRRVVLHRDVCGRIPTHMLACLYFYTRRNLRYAVGTHRQPQAWTSAPAAGAWSINPT